MKKRIALLLVLVMTLALFTGCAAKDTTEPKTTTEPVELIVFAAASMTETLNQIAERYKDVAPNVTLVFNFDSSGTLKTQIEEGADCDVFISAAPKQMNALDSCRRRQHRRSRLRPAGHAYQSAREQGRPRRSRRQPEEHHLLR